MERRLVEVAFEVTYKCNLRCRHCYNRKNLSNKEEMETREVFKALEIIRRFGAEKVKFGGGEPLTRRDFFEILNHANGLGFETNFSSNGLLIQKNLQEIVAAGMKRVQISLDSVGEKHDTARNYKGLFKIVENSARILKEKGIKVDFATTLTRNNHRDFNLILDFCKRNNARRWRIMKYIPYGIEDKLMLTKKEYKAAIESILKLKGETKEPEIIVAREFDLIRDKKDYNDMQCFGGKSFFSLKANGNVTPCSYIDNIICGNILRDRIEDIWNNIRMVEFSRDHHDTGCEFAEKCKGGCKAVSLRLGKKVHCDPYCWTKMSRNSTRA